MAGVTLGCSGGFRRQRDGSTLFSHSPSWQDSRPATCPDIILLKFWASAGASEVSILGRLFRSLLGTAASFIGEGTEWMRSWGLC
jgi:hypothetical protein